MKVLFDEKTCIHAGECVKRLPEVFKVEDGQFVIDETSASEAAVRKTVSFCPSGALSIEEEE